MYAVQAEYRRPLFGRFGFVAFAGVGSIAKSFGSFNSDDLLPSVGAGVRYMASRKYRVNVSMDYAVGKSFHGFYFYIGEAFWKASRSPELGFVICAQLIEVECRGGVGCIVSPTPSPQRLRGCRGRAMKTSPARH
jgi:hypothetical protein